MSDARCVECLEFRCVCRIHKEVARKRKPAPPQATVPEHIARRNFDPGALTIEPEPADAVRDRLAQEHADAHGEHVFSRTEITKAKLDFMCGFDAAMRFREGEE